MAEEYDFIRELSKIKGENFRKKIHIRISSVSLEENGSIRL